MGYTANSQNELQMGTLDEFPGYIFYSDGRIYSKYIKKFLTPIKKTTGYYGVNLYGPSGQRKMYFIHRLIAKIFIPNPNGYPDVNHKDEDKSNNAANNLEWCTESYNEKYGTKKDREMTSKERNGSYNRRKKVSQYDLNNKFIKSYESITQAAKEVGTNAGNISGTVHGKQQTAAGYYWRLD